MVSIILCSADDKRFEAASRMYRRLLTGPLETIRVVGARSLADGYNRAFAQSHGELVILAHEDVQVLTGSFETALRGHMGRFDLIGVAGTTKLIGPKWFTAGAPYIYGQVAHPADEAGVFAVSIYSAASRSVGGIQALDGLFLAARRHVLERVPFDAETFDGFHLYDLDFTFRAHHAKFRLGVASDLHLFHASGGRFDAAWDRYAARFTRKHAAVLPADTARSHRWAVVHVRTLDEAVEVMTPPHWHSQS